MKHAKRMVVLSEEEYIKLKNADVGANNNNNNNNSSSVKTIRQRRRKTAVKGQDKSARVSDKNPVKSRKSNVNRKHRQSMSRDKKLDKKKNKTTRTISKY